MSLFGSRVIARTANPPLASARIALTRPPPCEPVEPTTAMIFLSAMFPSLYPSSSISFAATTRSAGRSPRLRSELSFILATMRASGFMPQSLLNVILLRRDCA